MRRGGGYVVEAWEWRRRLWDWEEELFGECRLLLANVVLHVNTSDQWRRRLDNSGSYYVRSAYDMFTSDGSNIWLMRLQI
jgi:hypothetical protein